MVITLAYKSQLEERKQQTVELDNSTVALDEQTMKLHKQFAFNQENFERLSILSEHANSFGTHKNHNSQRFVYLIYCLTKLGELASLYSLKHTSTVLGDHEDTLRRKVSTLQTNVEQE